ncbi:MAG: DUF4293 domain-containing protein [Bacteroidales bacterium]|nr:DUF4293 domain-containing protein [Bacteroidales bacterium]
MIQRIQTLYLFIASGLLFSMFFSKICFAPGMEPVEYTDYTPFIIFIAATFIISFFTIFIFHHRMLQIRLCIFNILVLLGFQGWVAFKFFTREPGTAFSLTAVFPLVAAILVFTALRYIARDEAMVRSADSIRSIRKKSKK